MKRPFKKGDVVHHTLAPETWVGTVSYLKGPILCRMRGDVLRKSYQVYWKGWNPHQPDRNDWTWDFALEKHDVDEDV